LKDLLFCTSANRNVPRAGMSFFFGSSIHATSPVWRLTSLFEIVHVKKHDCTTLRAPCMHASVQLGRHSEPSSTLTTLFACWAVSVKSLLFFSFFLERGDKIERERELT
jgi:hypothetical protein